MNAVAKAEPTVIQTPQAERIRASSPVLRGQYPKSHEEAEHAKRLIEQFDTKADQRWIAQRAVKFLAGHYFVAEMAEPVAEQIGRDWTMELSGLPDWAIEAAFSWWISRHNPKRAKKPLPGDISERAHIEAAMISTGRKQVEFFERYGNNPPAFLK